MPGTYLNPNGSGSSGVLPPLEVLAKWPAPNYDDPITRPKVVPALAGVLGTIMIIVVAARTWARFFVQRNGGLDDWIILLAMIPTIGFTIVVYIATEVYGFDRHMWDVTPNLYVPERKIVFAVYLLYILAGGLIKISILLFYRRLDARCIPSTFRIATWLSIAIITIFITAFTIILFTACNPLAAFWYQFDAVHQLAGYKYHCWVNEEADIMAASIISAVQDAIAAFLPTLLYWNLQIPKRQKIALGAVFASGYLVCIVCIARVFAIYTIFNNELYDSSWTTWPALLLAVLEIQLGAIVASAPALKVFAKHYFSGASAWGSASARFTYGSGRATDGSVRQGEFRKQSDMAKSASTMERGRGGAEEDDEEGDVALLELRKTETRIVGMV
ncbi:hypothetical protein COCSADRAFT_144159 [Bipolaris sorokiniana ND90Pr]|uniref:Rhodopsin domain-containing protein n=1 Tax=Cochliobolus sativus (strain ND90Pr / ATCC 201652) TaxID=665912 RepID=M2SN72_COCSN|nr:uncharacterized protein COCSADRAFT_144159 [Bipolaris sorokiniana ND90Pr]EMD63770.1 hypothetical protein COCSADRAFT_144159 [Bipolaris sorokiniana ND90Pr]